MDSQESKFVLWISVIIFGWNAFKLFKTSLKLKGRLLILCVTFTAQLQQLLPLSKDVTVNKFLLGMTASRELLRLKF